MSDRLWINQKLKSEIFSRDNFSCQKCGFKGRSEELEVHHIKMSVDGEDNENNLITLCSICHHYAPDEEGEFSEYLNEKIDGLILDTFRRSAKSISRRTKKGMSEKSKSGNPTTRPPYGYKFENKQLMPDANTSFLVSEMFEDFLKQKISLTQLAKKYGFSVNGFKKVLTNQTYLGKVKFDGQTHQGTHQQLVSSTLFNHVQNKLEELGIKPISK